MGKSDVINRRGLHAGEINFREINVNWMENKVRRTCTMRIVLAVIVLVGVIGGLAANARYFKNYFKGPYAIPQSELFAAPNADALPRYWVTLTADEMIETGFQEITIRKKHGVERSRKVSATYYMAAIGDRYLLVKAHDDKPPTALKGFLTEASGSVDKQFFQDPEIVKIRSQFLPMMLDTEDFQTDGQIGMGVAALLGIGALVFGGVALARYRNPGKHPAIRRLANWGNPEEVGAAIESELNSGKTLKMGGHVFTPNFLVRDQAMNFDVQALDEFVWAYKNVINKKVYYVIPAGKTVSVKLSTMNNTTEVTGKEDDVDAVLNFFVNYRPWVVVGYSDELEKLYKRKRNEFAALVKQRHEEINQSANQAQSA